ncbi:MAG: YqaJ viral recombinase family protein [Flavobacteriales bacterium]|nr:YqaJ viral recombinase family protein [Flavobacteriales bacterium]
MKTLQIKDHNHWLDLRRKFIGASEIAALFFDSPYQTPLELYLIKSGKIESKNIDSERVEWGKKLEAPIAEKAASDLNVTLSDDNLYYMSTQCKKMGCTPDRLILDEDKKVVGVMEIKNVAVDQYMRWEDKNPPLYYEMQVQHQMECTDVKWGCNVFLVGGNKLVIKTYSRNQELIDEMIRKINAFWEDVEKQEMPKVCSDDFKLLDSIYQLKPESFIDMSESEDFNEACKSLNEVNLSIRELGRMHKDLKSQIANFSKGNSIVKGDGFTVYNQEISRKECKIKASVYRKMTLKIDKVMEI